MHVETLLSQGALKGTSTDPLGSNPKLPVKRRHTETWVANQPLPAAERESGCSFHEITWNAFSREDQAYNDKAFLISRVDFLDAGTPSYPSCSPPNGKETATSWVYQGLGAVGSKSRIFSQLSHLQVEPLFSTRDLRAHRHPHISEVGQSEELLVSPCYREGH